MIKKTCLSIGVAIALVSSPVVGAELDKEIKAQFCEAYTSKLNKHMRTYVETSKKLMKAVSKLGKKAKAGSLTNTDTAFMRGELFRDFTYPMDLELERIQKMTPSWKVIRG